MLFRSPVTNTITIIVNITIIIVGAVWMDAKIQIAHLNQQLNWSLSFLWLTSYLFGCIIWTKYFYIVLNCLLWVKAIMRILQFFRKVFLDFLFTENVATFPKTRKTNCRQTRLLSIFALIWFLNFQTLQILRRKTEEQCLSQDALYQHKPWTF